MNLLPQFGFFELVVVAIIALVVVGPQELPRLMRMAGKFAAQARRMASEFTAAFDQMARESEMEEMRKEIEALKKNNPVADAKREFEDAVKPAREALNRETNEINKTGLEKTESPAKPDIIPDDPIADDAAAPAETTPSTDAAKS
jgi:sec-independent protein translocase protein TatB